MNDPVSQVFGYILIVAAVLLAVRERHSFQNRGADAWLVTRRRYRRRMLVSIVLGTVGALIAAWGHGYIDFRDPDTGAPNATVFMFFVFALTGLSMFLLILALLDFSETARNASRHAMEEFALPGEKPDAAPKPDEPEQSEEKGSQGGV